MLIPISCRNGYKCPDSNTTAQHIIPQYFIVIVL